MLNKDLKKRIIEIAYKNKLSHLGSYLSCVDTISKIYDNMNQNDIFILSNGHASLAQYVVLEKKYGIDAELLFNTHGGHPHLNESHHIYCSTGSLGMGISVAIGRALANKNRSVHVMISDGECAEGVIWESLRFIADHKMTNIFVYVIINGYSAYDSIDKDSLKKKLAGFNEGQITTVDATSEHFPFLKGLNAHYHVMREENYKLAMEMCQ